MRLRLAELVRQKEIREGRKIRQQEIAEALGISQQQVSVLMRGSNKQISLRLLDRLAEYFEVSVQELFEAPISREELVSLGAPLRAHDLVMLPVYGRIPAGPPDAKEQEVLEYYPWPTSLGARPGCYVLIVEGDSMVDAHVLPGSRVILDPKLEPRSGDIVAVLIDGESTLKRLYIDANGRGALISENRERNYPPIFLDNAQDVRIQGVVVNIVLTPESRRRY